MTSAASVIVLALACALGGCATPPPPNYSTDDKLSFVAAVKTEAKTPLPVPVTVTRVVPSPGQLRPLPTAQQATPSGPLPDPHQVIDAANEAARKIPDLHGYYNAMMTYDFDPGALYRVYAAPLQLTDIQLQPGERMISQPAAGDTTRWKVAASLSMENGQETQHLLLTPKRPTIHTSLVIATDRRTYHLELFSDDSTYMAAVNWNYPQDTLATYDLKLTGVARDNALVDAAHIDLKDANFAYTIKVKDGHPAWTPLRVFDNGTKTYIQFPEAIVVTDAPALYLKKYGTQQIVNYRMVGKYYIVDGIFPRYELRVGGTKEIDVVEIVNENARRS